MIKYFAFFVCILLAMFMSLSPAMAQGGDDMFGELTDNQKRELIGLIDAGRASYDRGEFERGLRYFKDAYDLMRHPDLLYRIALCHERLGEDADAVRYYRQFLRESPDAEERGRIENMITVIERRLAQQASRIRINTDPPQALIYINDISNGVAGYTPTELPVSAANYKIIIRKEGYEPIDELIDVPPGQTVVLRYALTRTPTVAKPAPSLVKPAVLTAIGVGALIGTVAFGIVYSQADEDYERLKQKNARAETNEDRIPRQEVNDAQAKSNMWRAVTWTSGGVAAVSLIWATVAWIEVAQGQASVVDPNPGHGFALWWQEGGGGMTWSTDF